jgi:flagellar biosynthesis protein FlhB
MAEKPDRDSRTEEATEKKVRDEIERGNVPVSREVSIFAFMAGLLVVMAFFLKTGSASLILILERLLDNANDWQFSTGFDVIALCGLIARQAGALLIPAFIVFVVAGLGASFAQNAPRIVFDRIKPDFSRISPTEGWHRMYSIRGTTEFLKSVAKFLAIALVVIVILQGNRLEFVSAMFVDPNVLPDLINQMAMRFVSGITVATLLLVTIDLIWSRVNWRKELRMSRQEVKDEARQSEGDPMVKARMRSLALDRRRRNMIAAVSRATMVVANPTHYAVAIRYVREEGGAPLVLAKGKDFLALRIRAAAEENNIPVVEDKALARSMYENVEVDRMIPSEFYRAVAELIHMLQRHGRRRAPIH